MTRLVAFVSLLATGGLDWPLVTGGLFVALALALTAALLSRRSHRPRPA